MTRRTVLRAATLTLVLILAIATAAFAHTALRSSAPAEDERLATAPTEIRLTFTSSVDPRLARIQLLTADSTPVLLDSVRANADDVISARIISALPGGEYTVAWQVIGTDGHPVRGRFAFAVDPAVDSTTSATVTDPGVESDPGTEIVPVQAEDDATGVMSPGYVAIRWLTFATILTIIGATVFRTFVLEAVRRRSNVPAGGAADEAATRAAGLGRGAAAFLLLAAAARLLLQANAMDAGGLGGGMMSVMLLETPWGWGWMLQVAAAALALVAFHRAAGHPRSGWGPAMIAGLVLAFTPALSGHAAAAESAGAIAIALDGVHVLAASAWIGTLLAILAAGVPAALRGGGGAGMVAELVAVFSPLALVFVAVVVGSGAVAAILHFGALSQLWTTAYGRTLLLKVSAVALVAAVGAYNWRAVRPRLGETGPAPFRRSAALELLAAAVVLVLTSVLVATPTP